MKRRACAAVLAAIALYAPATASAADPRLQTPTERLDAALTCGPDAHPDRPTVLLVHGTGSTAAATWSWNYQKVLPGLGWDVCSVELPGNALGDIQVSSEYVVRAVDRIYARTKRKVSIIGHSQGGLEPRWAAKWWSEVRRNVDDLIQLAAPNHGIALAGGCKAMGPCWPAVLQMRTSSDFLAALNDGDETPGAIDYTAIYSQNDEIIQPFSTVPIQGSVSIAIQSICLGRPIRHGPILSDAVSYAIVIDALSHPGPASHERVFDITLCTRSTMPGVTDEEAFNGSEALYSTMTQSFAAAERTANEPAFAPYVLGQESPPPAAQQPKKKLTTRQRCKKRYPKSKRKQRQCIKRHRKRR